MSYNLAVLTSVVGCDGQDKFEQYLRANISGSEISYCGDRGYVLFCDLKQMEPIRKIVETFERENSEYTSSPCFEHPFTINNNDKVKPQLLKELVSADINEFMPYTLDDKSIWFYSGRKGTKQEVEYIRKVVKKLNELACEIPELL